MTTAVLAPETTPRVYQLEDVGRLRQAIVRYGSVVYVLPTGAGKTVVAGLVTEGAIGKGGQVVFVVHRRELVKQAVNTLGAAVPGLSIGVEAPGWPSMPWAPLQVGMVQSMVRRPYVAKMRPSVVIWDEAHHVRASTWETALSWWPDTPRIGLTATPERLDGKGLGAHFAAMVEGPTIEWLVNNINPQTGIPYLAPSRTLTIPTSLDTEGLKANRQGEYGAGVSERITDTVVADAADAYIRYAEGRRAIFFGENRDHSRRVVERLNEMGVRAAHVDGDDHPARRDRVMAEFRDGALDVVGNCDLISEGFDAPACDAAILGKRTGSITRYLQQAGRPMRPGYAGKEALILDLAGISYNLGLPDESREWSLEDGELKERREGEREPKACPNCRTAYYGPRCPHCAHELPLTEIAEEQYDLVEATGRTPAPPKKPKGRRAEIMADLAQAYRTPDPKAAIRAIGERRGYHPRWAEHIIKAKGL